MFSWFNKLKIGHKLALGFALPLVLAVLVGVVGILRVADVNSKTGALYRGSLVNTGVAAKLISNMKEFRLLEWIHVVNTDGEARTKLEKQMKDKAADIDKQFAGYKKNITTQADRTNYKSLEDAWHAYTTLNDGIIALNQMNDTKSSLEFMMGESLQKFEASTKLVDKMTQANIDAGKGLMAEAEAAYASAWTIMGSLLLSALVVGTVAARVITKQVGSSLQVVSSRMMSLSETNIAEITRGVAALAQGDLTQRLSASREPLEVKTKDEIGKLTETYNSIQDQTADAVEAFNSAQESLRSMIGDVTESAVTLANTTDVLFENARTVGEAAGTVTRAMEETARATEQSANACQDMAVLSTKQQDAVESAHANITATAEFAEQVGSSTNQVAKTAAEAAAKATQGSSAVSDTLSRMGKIQEEVHSSSENIRRLGSKGREIGAIVETINQIAEQTNLLALNAAIEAARAGEAGRGFAVVAEEVRKLAERAGGATSEIGSLISSIQAEVDGAVVAMERCTEEVETGSRLSQAASEALEHIQTGSNAVSGEVQAVRAATEEMAKKVKSALQTMETLRELSARNDAAISDLSSMTEEMAATADEVSSTVNSQASGIQHVDQSASELREVAKGLQELVLQFRLNADKAGKDSVRIAA